MNLANIAIEKNVPVPTRHSKGLNGILKQLAPGDSIFVPGGTSTRCQGHFNSVRLQSPGWKFMSRAVSESGTPGVRIWRTA